MKRTSQTILDDFAKLTQQLDDAAALQAQLERDVATATDALELSDEKAIAALQTKQTQLAIAPRKLALIEARLAALEPEADALVTAETTALSRRASAEREKWFSILFKTLRPFCNTNDEAASLASQTSALQRLGGTGVIPPRIGTDLDRLRWAMAATAEFEQFAAELEKSAK